MFRVDPPAFRLVPLIFAAGRDELLGIRTVNSYVVYQGVDPIAVVEGTKSNYLAGHFALGTSG